MSDGTHKSTWTRGYEAGYATAQEEFGKLMERAILLRREEEPNLRAGKPNAGRTGQKGRTNGSIEFIHRTYG